MKKYNFDQIINRNNTQTIKYGQLEERFGKSDLGAFWIADMDFLSPPAVTEAIIERAKHGVFGYTFPCDSYYQSIIDWLGGYHHWKIEKEWIHFIPGVVKGIAFAIDCFLGKSEKLIIQPPIYPPFRNIPLLHAREIIENNLIEQDGSYEMDLVGLENIMENNPDVRILILCNPHNPIGIAWDREILKKVADLCDKYNIMVISDEIHADLVFECQGYDHTPYASVSDKAANHSITLMAPSKTFNIAGLISSFSVIPNEKLRTTFATYLEKSELTAGHIFAYTATQAAYNHGLEWLTEVKEYIWQNVMFVEEYLKNNIPVLKIFKPQASFLIWLDCRELGLSSSELNKLFVDKAGLALNNGITFGTNGNGFMRFNVGTSRVLIEEALNKLKKAIDNYHELGMIAN